MKKVPYDHFGLLIFGQGIWKENFTQKISKDTKINFFHLSGYSKDSLFCTCPVCNAMVKLFDPMNPDCYVDLCELCKPIFKKFKKIKGKNEGIIFLSHNIIRDFKLLQNLTGGLLSKNQIKKIYILEIEYNKILKPIPVIIDSLGHKRLSKSEFQSFWKIVYTNMMLYMKFLKTIIIEYSTRKYKLNEICL